LVTAELVAFLEQAANDAETFHFVLSADVFVYLSDLVPIAHSVARVLATDGLFAFSVETQDGGNVVLQPTLRYAHSVAHVQGAIEGAGLTALLLESASTRTENGVPVPGLVVVAAKPASTASPSAANSNA
jgi:predicted TPR repeat methyltransferase